jgi:hypothetical protein
MSKKKLIFLVSNDLETDQRMQKICAALSTDLDVHIWGRALDSSTRLKSRAYQQKYFQFWFNKGKLFYLEMNLRFFLALLFSKADIISAVDLDTLIAAYYSAKWKGKALVFDAHEYYSEVPELIGRTKEQGIWKKVENKIIPKIKYAYTVNQSLANLFKDQWKTDFKVIRNVPKQTNVSIQANDKRTILYQGAVNDGRGIKEMMLALKADPVHQFLVLGDGDLLADLKALKKEEGISNVQFAGKILPEALPEKTAKAWIGVNLLEHKGMNYYYSLANKFWDYAAAGIPQICMSFPEYQLLNEQYEVAILVDNLEAKNLVNAIKQLEDEDTYQRLQANCKSLIDANNWEQEAQKLKDFYSNI